MKKTSTGGTSAEKTVSKSKKVWGIIGNVAMWIFIVFAVAVTIFAFSAQSSADGIPTIGGKVMSPVLTDSMEPTINKGDIILSRKLDDSETRLLKVGDIITFKADLDGDGSPEINTHRIVEVNVDAAGFTSYKTKGDNPKAPVDQNPVSPTDVISIFDENSDTRIPVLGSVISFLLTSLGFFLVIVVPLILFFIFEIIMFVRRLIEVKNAGKKQITVEDEELIKQRAIEEYIRSQQKAQSDAESAKAEETPAEEPAEAPAEEPAEAPTEEPAEAPAEEVAEAPTEEPAEAPAEEPAEAPAEEPAEAPVEEPAEAPVEEPAEEPAEEEVKKPIDNE